MPAGAALVEDPLQTMEVFLPPRVQAFVNVAIKVVKVPLGVLHLGVFRVLLIVFVAMVVPLTTEAFVEGQLTGVSPKVWSHCKAHPRIKWPKIPHRCQTWMHWSCGCVGSSGLVAGGAAHSFGCAAGSYASASRVWWHANRVPPTHIAPHQHFRDPPFRATLPARRAAGPAHRRHDAR